MNKYSTCVTLRPENPFTDIEYLFTNGFPMRDPFPMYTKNYILHLWLVDCDRMSEIQFKAFLYIISGTKHNYQELLDKVLAKEKHIYLQHHWISKIYGGRDTYWRTIELYNFLDANNTQESLSANLCQFLNSHYDKWIANYPDVPLLPKNYQDVDHRLKSPELERYWQQNQSLIFNSFNLM